MLEQQDKIHGWSDSHAATSGRAGYVDNTAPQQVRHATRTSVSVEGGAGYQSPAVQNTFMSRLRMKG